MITSSEIARAALRRFLPGATIGALATSLMFGSMSLLGAIWPRWIIGSVATAALATLGFAGAMIISKRYMRSDAGVTGRKSVLAGIVATAIAFSLLAFFDSYVVMSLSLFRLSTYHIGRTLATPVVAGAVATFALYFPWMSRQSDESNQPLFAQPMTGAARFMLRRLSTRMERQQ